MSTQEDKKTNNRVKSKEVTFTPLPKTTPLPFSGYITIKQTTPGAVNLVFQAILPYLLFHPTNPPSPIRLKITGGTNVSNSPSCEYVAQVLLPMLALLGIPEITSEVHARGWSQGRTCLGSVTYTITPLSRPLPAFQLTQRGEVESVMATVVAPGECEQEMRDELDGMFERRHDAFFGGSEREARIETTFEDSRHEKRFYLLLVATTDTGMKVGRDWLYSQPIRPNNISSIISTLVKKVSKDLIAELNHVGCVDEHLRDQLVVFQALAQGRSVVYSGEEAGVQVPPSLHARTAMWVAKEVVGVKFDEEGGCEGIGFAPNSGEDEAEIVKGVESLRVEG
jgi:RNA 3'-terminal phosphate cyclase (ATP)